MERRQIFKYPAISRTHVAFVYAGDIWIGPKGGGRATKLTSAQGQEMYPRFSPEEVWNDEWIAFSAGYAGSTDIYAVPTAGGVPQRLTFDPMDELMVDWLPDGSILFARDTLPFYVRRLYRLKLRQEEIDGCSVLKPDGAPQMLSLRYGSYGHVFGGRNSSQWKLAFQPVVRGFSRFKGYRGALAPEIHLADLMLSDQGILDLSPDTEIRNLTQSNANDSHPMWSPDGKGMFFVSDREMDKSDRYNLYIIEDLDGYEIHPQPLTFNKEADVRAPSIGPHDIVWEEDGLIHCLPLDEISKDKPKSKKLTFQVSSNQMELMPRWQAAGDLIGGFDLSADGKKVALEARGQIFVVEGSNGPIRPITRKSGVGNRYPTFSPDGKTVAYFSDTPRGCENGVFCDKREYHLVTRGSDGRGKEDVLHCFENGFRFRIFWSPQRDRLAFADLRDDVLGFYDFSTGEFQKIDELVRFIQFYRPLYSVSWSPCGTWLAYATREVQRNSILYLYNVEKKQRYRLTRGYYEDTNPVFDPDGHYLFYLTKRNFSAIYSEFREGIVFVNGTQVAAVRLNQGAPWVREWSEAKLPKPASGNMSILKTDLGAGCPMTARRGEIVDWSEEFESRIELLDIDPGMLDNLQATRGKIYFLRTPLEGLDESNTSLRVFDFLDPQEKTIVCPIDDYRLAREASTLLIRTTDGFALIPAEAEQDLPKANAYLPTDKLQVWVDPAKDWMQIFHDAWRIARDDFFDSERVGDRWEAIRDHYVEFISGACSSWDVDDILNRMLGELRASHTSVQGVEPEAMSTERKTGYLGADWELEEAGLRIRRVIDGGLWNTDFRSPLVDLKIKTDSLIVSVNGVAVHEYETPELLFDGLAEQYADICVEHQDGSRSLHKIRLFNEDEEQHLRYLAWVEGNRRFVEDNTPDDLAGQIGYVHIPDVTVFGRGELLRQFQWQVSRRALIFDARFNYGGNQTPERFLRLISQQTTNFLDFRYDDPEPTVALMHLGKKALLVHSWTASYGEHLARLFQQMNLGHLVGSRTAGVALGSAGSPDLIDGTEIYLANWIVTDAQGEVPIEGVGVPVDLENSIDESLSLLNSQLFDNQLKFALDKIIGELMED